VGLFEHTAVQRWATVGVCQDGPDHPFSVFLSISGGWLCQLGWPGFVLDALVRVPPGQMHWPWALHTHKVFHQLGWPEFVSDAFKSEGLLWASAMDGPGHCIHLAFCHQMVQLCLLVIGVF